jgi:hypothetical protein
MICSRVEIKSNSLELFKDDKFLSEYIHNNIRLVIEANFEVEHNRKEEIVTIFSLPNEVLDVEVNQVENTIYIK